jgi:hypothetical protein
MNPDTMSVSCYGFLQDTYGVEVVNSALRKAPPVLERIVNRVLTDFVTNVESKEFMSVQGCSRDTVKELCLKLDWLRLRAAVGRALSRCALALIPPPGLLASLPDDRIDSEALDSALDRVERDIAPFVPVFPYVFLCGAPSDAPAHAAIVIRHLVAEAELCSPVRAVDLYMMQWT